MKIMIDINHPAHVHFFKNFIWEMEKKGHEFLITARDKECSLKLLDAYKFKYIKRKSYKGLLGKGLGMLMIDHWMCKAAKKFKPDIMLGVNNTYIAHTSCLLRKKSIIFNDTEHAKLANKVTYPFATIICTPSCYKLNLGKKQIRYDGYHELTYLHSNHFKPNPDVLKEVGLNKNERFFIVRFVSWEANHDIGEYGIKDKIGFVKVLEKYGKVLISSEGGLPKEIKKYQVKIEPEKIHDLMYYATLYIGEGATMASEAAVLGIPSIYISSLQMGYTRELEKKYSLLYQTTDLNLVFNKIKELLKNQNLRQEWQKKRKKMLEEKIDVTNWMIGLVENFGRKNYE